MSHASEPGVRITRRATLGGVAALPALWAVAASTASASPGARGDVGEFLEDWTGRALAAAQERDPNEEALLFELIAGLNRIDPGSFPERKSVSYEADGLKSGPILANASFLVLQFDMEPGAVIRPHNHVGWGFVSMGLQGEVLVRHFEPDGAPPDPGSELNVDFPLREVSSALLTRGRTSSLTRTRANIHAFRAGAEGARFIDFGVNYAEAGAGYRSFSALDLDEQATDAERRVYTARWIGNPYKKD